MTSLPPSVEKRLRSLPVGLQQHVCRVRSQTRTLAHIHGLDVNRTDIGAASHDLFRAVKDQEMLSVARHYRLEINLVEKCTPLLLHGPIAALWLQSHVGVNDKDILEAVRFHTTGHKNMGDIAKAVYLADKLDPCKISQYPWIEQIRTLAKTSLDQALLLFLNKSLQLQKNKNQYSHPFTVELRNTLLQKQKDRFYNK